MAHEPYIRMIPGSDTAVLMLHGIIGTPEHFRDMIPLIPADWSICNILLDGHGKEVTDFSHTSMARWKQQVAARLEQLSSDHDRILIAAHSMGTLFAIRAAVQDPHKIAGLFLMGSCLAPGIKRLALSNACKVALGRVRPDDAPAMAAQNACSIHHTRRLWQYLGWPPRYWELLQEIRAVRPLVQQLQVPCWVYQSRQDELVSVRAAQWFAGNPHVHCQFLENSTHFHYSPADYRSLLDAFSAFCQEV